MKINAKALNKGEVFCCSIRDAKSVFGNADLIINFASNNKNYEQDSIYKLPKVKGKVISCLTISNTFGQIGALGGSSKASLNFYVLKHNEIADDLLNHFSNCILPTMYSAFVKHKNGNPGNISGMYYFRVELLQTELVCLEGIAS